ncbi:hypothetical protein FACS1894172_09770 [Spirochaetia bacterium]|nr:hypothetical protein FACS1894164_08250 [Spirochaetia bacterium]GHU32695.1 hypothetical protein FACS1894172_09770 [Spirochaetia bacterium]
MGIHCAAWVGIFLEYKREKRLLANSAPLPPVSVIIPVHNEEFRIKSLLDSLAKQQYPAAEIIFVENASTDNTIELLRTFAAEHSAGIMVKLITLNENPGPNHKQYALEKGIEASSGEIFLFTDADCELPPDWIREMTCRFADPSVGIIIGPVFKKPGGDSFFHLYQCFDHAIRYLYLVGATGLGSPGGGFGNNLGIRRKTLDVVGGYSSVPFSPTEDAALVARVRTHSTYHIRSVVGKPVFVMTQGESTWKALINQTLRWNNGGLFGPDLGTRLNFGFLMITIGLGIIAIPVLAFIPSLWPLSAAVMTAMAGNTLICLRLFGSALPKKGAAYIVQCIFTPMYFTFLTILGFCRVKVYWKDSQVS